MNVRRKMLLIVTASILMVAVSGIPLIYGYAQHKIVEKETITLAEETAAVALPSGQRFAEAGVKLSSLARLLQAELARPSGPDELAAFNRLMVRDATGVYRNRKPGFDGTREAGIFLPPNAHESDAQKVAHLRIKRVLDTFGAAASRRLENTWFLSPDRSEIIYDANFPDFTSGMAADNDYTQTPWLTYTSPEFNPSRELRFTPPLYDPVAHAWMVSAIYPLYQGNNWLGTIGEDMQLGNVLGYMLKRGELYSEEQHFLLDLEGHFVLAGDWQAQLEAQTSNFSPDFGSESQLATLFKFGLTAKPIVLSRELMVKGREYVAVGMRLEPLGWRYFRLVPVDQIMAATRELFYQVIGMILLMSVLSGVMIEVWLSRSIVDRLKSLAETMRHYGSGPYDFSPELRAGRDEIAQVAHAFDEMAENIGRHVQQVEATRAELESAKLFAHATLDGLTLHLCVLDQDGVILSVNEAWREFGADNGGLAEKVDEGANYLQVCMTESASGHSCAFGRGLHDVLAGHISHFESVVSGNLVE